MLNDLTVFVDNKFVEIPVNFAALLHWVVRAQVSENWMHVWPIDIHFLEDGEFGALVSPCKGLDLLRRRVLLIEEVAGGESENLETLVPVLAI